MIFLDRRRAGEDPHLLGRIWIFGAGAVLALLGIGLESSLLVILAIMVLLAGFTFRLFLSRPADHDPEKEEEEGRR